MERLRSRLFAGMAERDITGSIAEEIWDKLRAFANFGFPESHSVSFAYLVYVSAWLKLRYPAAFLAALLNSQPMGFWAPHTLVADARRHGVSVLGPDVNVSEAVASLEGQGSPVVRLGVASVKGIGADLAEQIAGGRPYADLEDLARRSGANRKALEALATAGAVNGLVARAGDVEARRAAGRCCGLSRRGTAAGGALGGRSGGRVEAGHPARDPRRYRFPTIAADGRGGGDGSRPADARPLTSLIPDGASPSGARASGAVPDLLTA